jgi:Mn2+/Fe2+ NRAMP family transporter
MLFSTNIGVLDYEARLTGDSLKVNYLGESEFWSESKIYITVVWAMIIAGIVILWAGLTQPLILLIIAAAGGGVVMALYSVMLIVLNRRTLPEVAKLKGWRVPVMVFIAIFFVFFSLLLVYDQISGLFGG